MGGRGGLDRLYHMMMDWKFLVSVNMLELFVVF